MLLFLYERIAWVHLLKLVGMFDLFIPHNNWILVKNERIRVYMETTHIYLWIMNKSDLFQKIAFSIIIGVFGSVLLVVFFSSFMSINTIEKLLPFVIGFNAALTGFNLISKTKNSLKYKRIYAVASGISAVIFTGVILNLISISIMGGYLIYITDLIILIVIGAVLSGFGAILAIKYLNLN